jgi:intraflagellar transport protein 140
LNNFTVSNCFDYSTLKNFFIFYSGTLTLWNEESRVPKEETNVHKDKINLIAFNPSGSRMVTADVSGLVAVWRGINNICTFKKQSIITHCIFCEINLDNKIKATNLFFFGGKAGVVCLADD